MPDVNLLVYAVNQASPFHQLAKAWWQAQLASGDIVCLGWNALYGFLRIITNAKAVPKPLPLPDALRLVEEWLGLPQIVVVQQTGSHFDHFKRFLSGQSATPKLITDAHFAALAIEHACELHTADSDFGKFPGLRWKNPLEPTVTAVA